MVPTTSDSSLCTYSGPGGIKLSYMGGDIITKTLNEAFGYDGWCLEVKNTTREESTKDDQGRHHVAYIATVRITHHRSGVFRGAIRDSISIPFLSLAHNDAFCILCHTRILSSARPEEDCGAGDAIDRCLASATGNALKGAVTDAMKRAARHFGEKLGNSLYHDGFNANNAPSTLKDALDTLDIDRAKSRFGFEKDAQKVGQTAGVVRSVALNPSNQLASMNTTQPAMANLEKTKPINHATNSSKPYVQQTPRTQYVGNVVMEHSNMLNTVTTNIANPPHVTPHCGPGNNAAQNTTAATKPTNTYVTPTNRLAATIANKNSTFNPSVFAAVPAEELSHSGKENANPRSHPAETGLALPPRPGTSRGIPDDSPTSAYIANYSDKIGSAPSMFGPNGTISPALTNEQSTSTIAQSLKRKSECLNPYTC
jgi:recombination DNA repair RAD52 pathway protein